MASGITQDELTEIALKQVYAENYPWFEQYVLLNSGTAADARDVFQESLMAAWINVRSGRFTGDAEQFNAYLRQICKYKWLNVLKSAGHRKTQYEAEMERFDSIDGAAETFRIQLEESSRLMHGFSRLGDKCRRVLSAFYYHRKPLADIARETGDTVESIKTIKYRCMMRLRKFYLEEEGNE